MNNNPLILVTRDNVGQIIHKTFDETYDFVIMDSPYWKEWLVEACTSRGINADMHTPSSTMEALLEKYLAEGKKILERNGVL